MNPKLELAIEDAIYRIEREYEKCNGKIYLSFSGGKDSTILASLIKLASLPTEIPFVFANTGIELNATVKFVKNYDYKNIVIVKPRKPFGKVLKEYGLPAISKKKSGYLNTYGRHLDNPMKTARARQLITGEAERGGVKLGFKTRVALAKKHFHFLHPEIDYKVADKCCTYLKKYPFDDFTLKNNMLGYFSGIRLAEGGQRSLVYDSCVVIKKIKGRDLLLSMPIIDWDDETCDMFVSEFSIKLSDAYTKYGAKRTGCIGCPYSINLKNDLKTLLKYEPNNYKASLFWLKKVYMDQNVELEWDETYMEEYRERKIVNEKRRLEMLEKFNRKKPDNF